MDTNRIILSVNFNDQYKLVSISTTDSYQAFVSSVSSKWPALVWFQISCVCNVGPVSNLCLEIEEDFSNMMLLCIHSSTEIVDVKLVAKISEACNRSNHVDSSDSSIDHGCSVSKQEKCGDGQSNVLKDKTNQGSTKKRCRDSYKKDPPSDQQVEFGGKYSVPSYDVCPIPKKKSLLSDGWDKIMSGGVGTEFTGGANEFRTELIKYSTQMGFKFKYECNDPQYIHAVCSESCDGGCGWFVKAKRQSVSSCFEIYQVNLIHNYVGKIVTDRDRRLGVMIIASLVLQKIKTKPTISGKENMLFVKESYRIDIGYHKAWRTVKATRDQIFSSYVESYDQLRWYYRAIERTNPESIVFLEPNPETSHFERLFIAFKACLGGFRSCSPMLFLDVTFMKGRAKGTLLSATAKDENNGLFPIAFAIVSAENNDNWIWFLEKLRDFVNHDKQIYFISDRNCGLMPVDLKDPIHFYCLYHLLTNLKGHFSTGWTSKNRTKLGEHFKACAYAPNTRIFEEKMNIFKEVGGQLAEKWLKGLPYEKWAVAYSPNITHYGEMTSNAVESFNSWIREARALPITYMIDSIRTSISRWYVERRQMSNSWTGALCASKQDLWMKQTEVGHSWIVFECPDGSYQVDSDPSLCVNLSSKSCSCYQWQVKGFPCAHAIAVIRKVCTSIYTHIEDRFFAEKYRECYKFDINPISDTERFECQIPMEEEKILPPILNRPLGHPKKDRITSFGKFTKKKSRRSFSTNVAVKWDVMKTLLVHWSQRRAISLHLGDTMFWMSRSFIFLWKFVL